MSGRLIRLAGLLAVLSAVQATYTWHSTMRCLCNGKSRYCLRDAWGLRCVDCQGNTEGRHCERCKDGFYQQGARQDCMPCGCHGAGSVSARCDSRGRCSCKEGVSGDKCDRCRDGVMGPDGCRQSRQPRQEAETPACFCFGHSSRCSATPGFSVHNITSDFSTGVDGWHVATAQGVALDDVSFRWSPKYKDIEVISKNSQPVYLHAPAPFLGNHLLSYGQNLSFSLRLDRGVRRPSTSDIILEGSGLRVSASLGDLRSIVPCGQKITYSFRLDERLSCRWRPQLSSLQFQMLLQNLTAIKIRATFGENGRGYLDNVQLVSARRGDGVPAGWVQSCRCPLGHQGQFCERCASGFKRRVPELGAFSDCEPCHCRGGKCDPETGDCYSADETPGSSSCPPGSYRDPLRPLICLQCPCPAGESCSLDAATRRVLCGGCPPGTTGSGCSVCQSGFYGNPAAGGCQPCRCNGHVDLSRVGSCDPATGECLQCANNTRGGQCEACLPGFFHRRPADACQPCECDPQGSLAAQCDDGGRCECRPGYEGLRCHRSACPACFNPVKTKMELYAVKLQELQALFSRLDGGVRPDGDQQLDRKLRAAEQQLTELQRTALRLADMEKVLQERLSSISRSQLAEDRDLQAIAAAAAATRRRERTYESKVDDVQKLIDDMRRRLKEAKLSIPSADAPQGDASGSGDAASGSGDGAPASEVLSSLAQKATELADSHQEKASAVERSANEALADAQQSLDQVRKLMNKENKVKELIGDLKDMYDNTSAQVKALENKAGRVSGEAKGESKMADGMLKHIAAMEKQIPDGLKEQMDAAVARLDGLKGALQENLTEFQDKQDDVEQDRAAVEDLLAQANAAQQDLDRLLARANAAKADTQAALRGIDSNKDVLDRALNALRGFDEQVGGSKAQADAAIQKLPGINATIQRAKEENAETLSILAGVDEDVSDAQETVGLLDDAVSALQGAVDSLPSHAGLEESATKLNKEVKALQEEAAAADEDLSERLDEAARQRDDAKQADDGAVGALSHAQNARDAVGQTLKTVSDLLSALTSPGSVDAERLSELEEAVAGAQRSVERELRPRLDEVAEREAAQRRRLSGLNLDIDSVLLDISNLEDILKAVPNGCFNHPPHEHA
ncbi:laminin subunit gamma-2 [Myripristis murdjan]|uniref:laminin subunit gamma-2 n=1 Tax=Myripristis murdjan TaxID=586833 RepID=UPI001175D05B|nr:laminin subunit gamma-2-like [Myripristis murdjan]